MDRWAAATAAKQVLAAELPMTTMGRKPPSEQLDQLAS